MAVRPPRPAPKPTDDTGSQLVRGQQEFRNEITDWQRDSNVNLDPRKAKRALDLVAEIQTGGIR